MERVRERERNISIDRITEKRPTWVDINEIPNLKKKTQKIFLIKKKYILKVHISFQYNEMFLILIETI